MASGSPVWGPKRCAGPAHRSLLQHRRMRSSRGYRTLVDFEAQAARPKGSVFRGNITRNPLSGFRSPERRTCST